MSNHLRLPKNGLIYFFTGEFAKDPNLWLIDLDTGSVTRCSSDNQASCVFDRTINSGTLDRLRLNAVKAWRRGWLHTLPPPAPGVTDDCYIVSGNRMAAFSPLEEKDRPLADEIERVVNHPSG